MAGLPGLFGDARGDGRFMNIAPQFSARGVPGGAPGGAPGAQGGAPPPVSWNDPSFGSTGQGYNANPNPAPTPYPGTGGTTGYDPATAFAIRTMTGQDPSHFGVQGAPQLGPDGRPLPPGATGTSNIDPTRGDLNNPLNPNLASGDIQRINRGGPGFLGNGFYINDPAAFRLNQADPMRQAYQGMYENATAGMDPTQQQQWRGQQQNLSNSLFGTIAGNTPSVAQEQLKQTTQGNVANQFAMAQANPNNPGAARMAATNAGNINQQAAGQGAMLRAQEIQGAQGMLGGVLSGARGQDLGAYQQAGQLGLGAMQGLYGVNQSMLNARMNQEAQQQNAYYGTAGHAIGGQLLGGALSGASAAGGALAGMAHGGEVKPLPVMGDRICAGCGHLNSECICGSRAQGGTPSPFAHGGAVPSVMGDRICAGCGHLNSECICGSRAQGGLIPGYARGGDSLANDTVSAKLSPGEIVLPRSITKADDAPDKAKAFVEAIRKKHKMKRAA